ncbi:putative UDP-Gal or UDP-GlcNAc-dependent glycosyltransferase [Trypanosoma cruzi]|nr:putative UDP-Gal or UDP-GlcNAc-dependent glycosyltransferase [Trypanosoma cruzi]
MLVLYVLGRHPSHGYEYSAALLEEAKQWQDVVALPMNEGRVTTKKKICGGGSWGDEAEIGMTRKVYMCLTLRSACSRQRVTFRRAMTTCFSACRCLLLTCASCRAEGSTWEATWVL